MNWMTDAYYETDWATQLDHNPTKDKRISLTIVIRDLATVLANSRNTPTVSGWVDYDLFCTTHESTGNPTLENDWHLDPKMETNYRCGGSRLHYDL